MKNCKYSLIQQQGQNGKYLAIHPSLSSWPGMQIAKAQKLQKEEGLEWLIICALRLLISYTTTKLPPPQPLLQIHHFSFASNSNSIQNLFTDNPRLRTRPSAVETQQKKSVESGQNPDGNSGSLSKSYAWVNPNSPRASQLRQKSYDSRYASLVKAVEYLNSCTPTESDVFHALKGLGDRILEQDAVVVLNNMSNPENALLALNYFQQNMKPKREAILYNVTLKVCRKGKDLDRAEKLFEVLRHFANCIPGGQDRRRTGYLLF